jgi:hypothetical protein
VQSTCGLIATVPFKSLDTDGDQYVKPQDYVGNLCNDYNCSGAVDGTDLSLLTRHYGHNCSTGPCGLLGSVISLMPDTGLEVGEVIETRMHVENNTTGPCAIDSVVFYQSGFDLGSAPVRFAVVPLGNTLPMGGAVDAATSYMIPGVGHGCVSARTYASCCDSSSLAEYCVEAFRFDCPAPTGFTFNYWVPTTPVYFKPQTSSAPYGFSTWTIPGEGWIVAPDTVEANVTISDVSSFGANMAIVMLFCSDNTCANIITRREFRVFYQQQRGDVNRSCSITSADIIYLVNHIFKSGPPPLPEAEAGDINCSGTLTASDVISLVNYVFKGGPPPLGECP